MELPQRLCRTIESPVGRLTMTEEDGALVRLAWADWQSGDPSALPGDTAVLDRTVAQLLEYFAGERHDFDLPLAPRGTAFQRRTWTEMTQIPYGETLSYGALARKLRSAPRAIGQACRTNPIPIIIPCHRVLAEGGRPGGFSGGAGLETKFALLQLEGGIEVEPDLFSRT